MKKLLFGFLVGVVAGAWGFWYFQGQEGQKTLHDARESVVSGAGRIKESIQETVGEISADDIRKELDRTSMVVREKATRASTAIADSTANARITAAVKTKLIAEPGLSAFSINVDTTDGLVTLSGTVSSHEQIAKAVQLALATEGVHKVISTLQVKPAK